MLLHANGCVGAARLMIAGVALLIAGAALPIDWQGPVKVMPLSWPVPSLAISSSVATLTSSDLS